MVLPGRPTNGDIYLQDLQFGCPNLKPQVITPTLLVIYLIECHAFVQKLVSENCNGALSMSSNIFLKYDWHVLIHQPVSFSLFLYRVFMCLCNLALRLHFALQWQNVEVLISSLRLVGLCCTILLSVSWIKQTSQLFSLLQITTICLCSSDFANLICTTISPRTFTHLVYLLIIQKRCIDLWTRFLSKYATDNALQYFFINTTMLCRISYNNPNIRWRVGQRRGEERYRIWSTRLH